MDFTAFVALVADVMAFALPFSDTVDITLGQLAIWTIVLGVGFSFGRSLIRG